jgi:hypothetical protein
MSSGQIRPSRIGANQQAHMPRELAPAPLALENKLLRQAVQANLVSFPSQVPVFAKQSRSDLQHKIVVLYFVLGWTIDDIETKGLWSQVSSAHRRAVRRSQCLPVGASELP